MEKLRFGIAGFGRHAVKRLMPGFAQAQRCVVTALSRREADAAASSAREHGIPHAFTTTAELCQCAEVDAIFVASPDSLHLPDVLTALSAGKHVLCEKPMGMNAAECGQMVEAAKDAGRILGVAQVFRFARSLRRAEKAVANGELGSVTQARIEFHYWSEGHARAWINEPTLACGGPIADVGVHCIDALRFVLQDEVTHVFTAAVSDAGSGPMESSALLTLEFAQGVLAEVGVSTRAHYRTPLEIVGSQGVLAAADCLSVDAPVRMEIAQTPEGTRHREELDNGDAFRLQADAFADAVRGAAAFANPGEEGWRNQMVLDAAYRSWKSGRREAVNG